MMDSSDIDGVENWDPKAQRSRNKDRYNLAVESHIKHMKYLRRLICGIADHSITSCKRRAGDTTLLQFSMALNMGNLYSCYSHENGTTTSREPHQHQPLLIGCSSAYIPGTGRSRILERGVLFQDKVLVCVSVRGLGVALPENF